MSNNNLIKQRSLAWEQLWSKDDFSPNWANRDCPVEIKKAFQNKIIQPVSKVLEVGCGLGEIANWFSINNFKKVDAFDISTSAINKAIKKHGNNKIKFFVHDLCRTPLTESYDIIVDRGCFHQIPTDLKSNFSKNLCQAANTHCSIFLFIKAFRGEYKLSVQDEIKFHTNEVKKYFCDNFKIYRRSVTTLSPDQSSKHMPGLFFYLKK